MLAPDRSFPRGSPVCDYWLGRCEGFTVRAGHRTLGVVESVARDGAPRTEAIVVRRGRRRRALAAAEVLAVVPARNVLLARRRQRAVRRSANVVAAASVESWMLVCRLAAHLLREVTRLTRLALAEIHDRNEHHGPEPSVRRAHRRPNDYVFAQQPLGRGRNVGPTGTR